MGQLTSRQEIVNLETTNPQMRNWLCASIAIRETSKVLAVHVHRKISQIHKMMRRSVGSLPACQQNCSQFSGDPNKPWCRTCDRWGAEIAAICNPQYKPRITWSRLNSSQWPVNPYEVGRAFIPRAHRLYYKSAEFHEDLRFVLSFLENCSAVHLPRSLCEKAWQCHGRVKRKNVRMRMGSQELEETVSVMTELLSQEDLGDNEDVINKMQALLSDTETEMDGCVVM
ncbi:unnamed protein product [Candidula unifasciata]|uniref:Uncharacterized protein n=1 Tax=Candidula unifasciata TaxID=100452 RepID=A0A8S3ZMS5_9EUPU|nr:unnamed protein product [Candidula unifasciata]